MTSTPSPNISCYNTLRPPRTTYKATDKSSPETRWLFVSFRSLSTTTELTRTYNFTWYFTYLLDNIQGSCGPYSFSTGVWPNSLNAHWVHYLDWAIDWPNQIHTPARRSSKYNQPRALTRGLIIRRHTTWKKTVEPCLMGLHSRSLDPVSGGRLCLMAPKRHKYLCGQALQQMVWAPLGPIRIT